MASELLGAVLVAGGEACKAEGGELPQGVRVRVPSQKVLQVAAWAGRVPWETQCYRQLMRGTRGWGRLREAPVVPEGWQGGLQAPEAGWRNPF